MSCFSIEANKLYLYNKIVQFAYDASKKIFSSASRDDKNLFLPNSHKLKVYSKNAFYELLTNLVLHLLVAELLIICS